MHALPHVSTCGGILEFVDFVRDSRMEVRVCNQQEFRQTVDLVLEYLGSYSFK